MNIINGGVVNVIRDPDAPATVAGTGDYWIGGELPPDHRMVLDVNINGTDVHLDSGLHMATSRFPMIEITLVQDPLPPDDPYVLHLIAVPRVPMWFSTETPFETTSGDVISDGDVLSISGRVICDNAYLTRNLGIAPPAPDIGYDEAAKVAKGAFASGQTVREYVLEHKLIEPRRLDELLEPRSMTEPSGR